MLMVLILNARSVATAVVESLDSYGSLTKRWPGLQDTSAFPLKKSKPCIPSLLGVVVPSGKRPVVSVYFLNGAKVVLSTLFALYNAELGLFGKAT